MKFLTDEDIDEIIRECADEFGVPLAMMTKKNLRPLSRYRPVRLAKGMAIHYLHEAGLSYVDIATRLKGRDHIWAIYWETRWLEEFGE